VLYNPAAFSKDGKTLYFTSDETGEFTALYAMDLAKKTAAPVLKAAWDAKHAAAPSLFGHSFDVTPGGNRFGLPAFYSLHAWIWKQNPAGRFAMWNPTVKC